MAARRLWLERLTQPVLEVKRGDVGVLSWKERSVVKLRTEVSSVNVRNDGTSRRQLPSPLSSVARAQTLMP
jgi:hypothetical protein